MRAPPGWVTAASWSGASSAVDRFVTGDRPASVLDGDHVDDRDSVDRVDEAERPGVEPDRRAVGQPMSPGSSTSTGARPAATARSSASHAAGPSRRSTRVGPQQVVQFVAGELEVGTDLERCGLGHQHRRACDAESPVEFVGERRTDLDHQPGAGRSGGSQQASRASAGVVRVSGPEAQPLGVAPGLREPASPAR